MVPHSIRAKRRVQQERSTGSSQAQHIDAIQEVGLMTGNETRTLDQVWGVDRPWSEPLMRNGLRA